jgi:A/G-specific adenine glycosylase
MLQQTQVSTVIPYYRRFMQRFPDIKGLASASLDDVLALWSGLGYYSRGRNLHKTARMIVAEHQGIFPREVEDIRKLPGVGRSTAAAIAVFAYGQRTAILDGNVKRILCRYFGMDGYPGERKNEIFLWKKAEELLPGTNEKDIKGQIEVYTQGLMDLGATVCTYRKPKCALCPLAVDCVAFRDNKVDRLPTPKPGKTLPVKETVLLLLVKQGQILLVKRAPEGIWGGLWCLPDLPMSGDATEYCAGMGMKATPSEKMDAFYHTFTHFKLRIHPLVLQVVSHSSAILSRGKDGRERIWLTVEDALNVAIPSAVRKLLVQLITQEGSSRPDKQRPLMFIHEQ